MLNQCYCVAFSPVSPGFDSARRLIVFPRGSCPPASFFVALPARGSAMYTPKVGWPLSAPNPKREGAEGVHPKIVDFSAPGGRGSALYTPKMDEVALPRIPPEWRGSAVALPGAVSL